MARQMRRQAAVSYQRQASEAGGMPQGVAEAFEREEGVMVGDTPVVAGCFVRADEGLFVADSGSLNGFRPTASRAVEGRERAVPLKALVPVGEVIYPGSAQHDACLVEAAAIEDQAERSGRVLSVYSDGCPDVATRRETDVMAIYSAFSHSLPAPHFPIAIPPSRAKQEAPLVSRIVDDQKSVIARWEGNSFVVSNTLEVTRDMPEMMESMRDYAIAHKMKMSAEDAGIYRYGIPMMVRDSIDEDAFSEALIGSDGDEIGRNVEALVSKSVPWFDFDGEAHSYLPSRLQRRAMMAVAEKMPGAESNPKPDEAPAGDGAQDPDEMVMIEGDTRSWKDRIKDYGNRYGSYRRWVRKDLAWRVRRQAWDALVADHPLAAQQLNLKG